MLSTVHSAKGQEWEAVHVLNVTDGSFPSEFSTGRAELIEEERRLLYVAMTRAKTRSPPHRAAQVLRDASRRAGATATSTARAAASSRKRCWRCMEEVVWPAADSSDSSAPAGAGRVDVAGVLRGMWGNA